MIESIKMIVGIDYDYHSLQKHKTIKYKSIGDIENLPFKDNSFNLITANMVVEHIENPTPVLVEVFRILKSNGIFIFHTTNLLNYQTFLTFLIPDLFKNKLLEFLEGRKEGRKEGRRYFPYLL
jgi:ubiquinone/menaquinone biosynthesis C-methylase UbiE